MRCTLQWPFCNYGNSYRSTYHILQKKTTSLETTRKKMFRETLTKNLLCYKSVVVFSYKNELFKVCYSTSVLIYQYNFNEINSKKLRSATFWRTVFEIFALYEKIIFLREQRFFCIKWKYEGIKSNLVLAVTKVVNFSHLTIKFTALYKHITSAENKRKDNIIWYS